MGTQTLDKAARTAVEIHPLIGDRWSPRAFDGAHELDDAHVLALLEAARWAPSAGNSQPWRFVVGTRGDDVHARLASTLAPGNQQWAPSASALILVAAAVADDDGKPQPFALYDAGQAAAGLSLQAQALGLSTHQMGGFDRDRAREVLDLPAHVEPLVVIAVGSHEPSAALPDPFADRERAPRERLPLSELLLHPAPGLSLAA
ncbi:MAG TPA: nitroreductase family protein [Mycobacteriales bacterium]|nr:nitroreductase family protein [Mycobacteriales bacterium]